MLFLKKISKIRDSLTSVHVNLFSPEGMFAFGSGVKRRDTFRAPDSLWPRPANTAVFNIDKVLRMTEEEKLVSFMWIFYLSTPNT